MVHIRAQLYIHAHRGHTHLFTLNDPDVDEVQDLIDDMHIEVLTTDGDDYVRVLGLDPELGALIVTRDEQSLYAILDDGSIYTPTEH